jgi:hypothetical protein
MNEESERLFGRVLVLVFIIEIIGILLSFIGAGTANPQFKTLSTYTSEINGTATNAMNAFSSNHTLLTLIPPQNSFFGVATFLNWLYNGIATLINFVYRFAVMAFNLIALLFIMLLIIGYVLLILLPSLFISEGVVGYVLSIGYVYLVAFLAYKYGRIFYEGILKFLEMIARFIP